MIGKRRTRNVRKSAGSGATVKSRARKSEGNVSLYASSHANAIVDAWQRLMHQPFATLMTLLVIGIALALPAGLYLVVQNARLVSGEWASAVDLSVYVTPGTDNQKIEQLQASIEALPLVDGVLPVSAAKALEEFKALSGFGRALDTLEKNPLPATLIVRPNAIDDDPEKMAQLAKELESFPNVDLVQLDTEWVARFHGILDVVRRAVFVVAALLAIAVLVIVGNTIRMEIEQRREEIEITKLVGATDGYIRRPFVYTGWWFGLLGGLISIGLVTAAIQVMSAPVSHVAGLYNSDFQLQGLVAWKWAWQLLAAVALGIIGSWVAANRKIRSIEPG